MKYNNAVVTISGGSFLSNALADKQAPVLDKMIILDKDMPADKSLESLSINDFSNGLAFDINNVTQNDNSFTATSVVKNTGIEQNYPAKLIAITGYVGQGNKQLIAVSQGIEPFIIEKQTDTPVTLTPSVTIGFSNASNIKITIKDDVYVSMKNLKGTLLNLGFVTNDDLNSAKQYLQSKISDVDSNNIKSARFIPDDVKNYDDFNKLPDGLYTSWNANNVSIIHPDAEYFGIVVKARYKLLFISTLSNNTYVRNSGSNGYWNKLSNDNDINALQSQLNSSVNNINGNIDKNSALISSLQNSALQYRRNLTDDDDLHDVNNLTNGIYELANVHPKNCPPNFSSGKFIMLGNGTGSPYNLFTLICLEETEFNAYIEYVRGWPYEFSGWKKMVSDDDLDSRFQFYDTIDQAKNALSSAPNNSLIIARGE